jgi:hypothetical protein
LRAQQEEQEEQEESAQQLERWRIESIQKLESKLKSNYEKTKNKQEQKIKQLCTGITEINPQLSGRVQEILTKHGQIYQDGVNRLNSQVLLGTMDQATRNNHEIHLRATLYEDRINDLVLLRYPSGSSLDDENRTFLGDVDNYPSP